MFRTRSNYIDHERSYTDIRNDLHYAYRKKGASAGIRFEAGRGLFLLNAKGKFRSWFDREADRKRRRDVFENAGKTLKNAINREYKGWKVNGQGLGDYVFTNLSTEFGARLDLAAIERIDELIQQGMAVSARQQKALDPHLSHLVAHHKHIFAALQSARQEEASRTFYQRWKARLSGDDNIQQLADHAAQWRITVAGSHLLLSALAADLEDNGVEPRQCYKAAAHILRDLHILRKGLTQEGHCKLIEYLANQGIDHVNVRKLKGHVFLKQNLAVSARQLRELNAQIFYQSPEVNTHLCKWEEIRAFVKLSEQTIQDIIDHHNTNLLTEFSVRQRFYASLKYIYENLRPYRMTMNGDLKKYDEDIIRIAPLLDRHLAAIHDIALALCEPNAPAEQAEIKPLISAKKYLDYKINPIDAAPLYETLSVPDKIYRSPKRHAQAAEQEGHAFQDLSAGQDEQDYNEACARLTTAISAYLSNPNADEDEIRRFGRRLAVVGRMNDGMIIKYDDLDVLGDKRFRNNQETLKRQRYVIQSLKADFVLSQGAAAQAAFSQNAKTLPKSTSRQPAVSRARYRSSLPALRGNPSQFYPSSADDDHYPPLKEERFEGGYPPAFDMDNGGAANWQNEARNDYSQLFDGVPNRLTWAGAHHGDKSDNSDDSDTLNAKNHGNFVEVNSYDPEESESSLNRGASPAEVLHIKHKTFEPSHDFYRIRTSFQFPEDPNDDDPETSAFSGADVYAAIRKGAAPRSLRFNINPAGAEASDKRNAIRVYDENSQNIAAISNSSIDDDLRQGFKNPLTLVRVKSYGVNSADTSAALLKKVSSASSYDNGGGLFRPHELELRGNTTVLSNSVESNSAYISPPSRFRRQRSNSAGHDPIILDDQFHILEHEDSEASSNSVSDIESGRSSSSDQPEPENVGPRKLFTASARTSPGTRPVNPVGPGRLTPPNSSASRVHRKKHARQKSSANRLTLERILDRSTFTPPPNTHKKRGKRVRKAAIDSVQEAPVNQRSDIKDPDKDEPVK